MATNVAADTIIATTMDMTMITIITGMITTTIMALRTGFLAMCMARIASTDGS
ncbi:protein of unknown function [Hyphomicrobium sp. MC1]|nr:protein of unknown function [Hyphomicrobium sp. MC1]